MRDNIRALISAHIYDHGQLKLRHYQRTCPAAAALIFLAMSFVAVARADNPSTLSPSASRADVDRKVYVALGDTVFAVEPGTPLVVHLSPDGLQKATPPPDPRQPGGRPGNPEQVQGIPFQSPLPWAAELIRPGYPTGDPDGVWGIDLAVDASVIRSGRSDKPLKDDRTFEADLDVVQRSCALPSVHEELPSGLTACSVEPPTPSESINYRVKAYIARPGACTTPLGKPFAINCGVRVHPRREWCFVRYHYSHDLLVAYDFNPVPPGAHLPIDRVIDFDRRLRDKLSNSLCQIRAEGTWMDQRPWSTRSKWWHGSRPTKPRFALSVLADLERHLILKKYAT
jgi:hypothetical protein